MPKDEWGKANQRKRYGEAYHPSRPGRDPCRVAKGVGCPWCGGKMLHKRNGKTGEPFLGCSTFPGCRGTLPVGEAVKPKRKGKRSRRKARQTEAERHMAHLGMQLALEGGITPPTPPGCLSEPSAPMGAPY